MDQNSGNGTDKRNWRERLGIGKPGTPATPDDMPKLADDFKSAPAATPAAPKPAAAQPALRPGTAKPAPQVPVKAAPMAPRPAARPAPAAGTAPSAPSPAAAPAPVPAAARPAAPRVAPVPPDALAAKLKDQREAAERLAVQRVQAAKQRAEAQLQASSAAGEKPKFTFADDTKADAAPAPAVPQRPAAPVAPSAGLPPLTPKPAAAVPPPYVAPPTPGFAPQVQPPRPPLGAPPSYAPSGYQQGGQGYVPPYPPSPGYQPPYPNTPYGQPPQYRPVDPATGYVPPPAYQPGARPAYGTMPPPAGPRLAAPARAPLGTDRPRLPARGPQMPMAPEAEGDDVFEAPVTRTPRRATANEYQQAYRDEMGYDEALPRSRGLGMLLGLVVLAVITALLAIYGYSYIAKSGKLAGGGGNVPVVAAPAGATKVTPDNNTATPEQAGKKQIYDRIEGDHEVPGSAMKSNEEAPVPPAGSGSSQTAPQDGAAQPSNGGGDGTPLPLPPPPGGGTGQQGALSPDGKTDMASTTPAAEPVSAANSSATEAAAAPSTAPQPTPAAAAPSKVEALPTPPAPGTPPAQTAQAPVAALPATGDATPGQEQIGNDPAKPAKAAAASAPAAKPAATATPAAAKPKKDAMKNLVLGKSQTKALGAKPLVLVPPSRIASAAAPSPAPLAAPQAPGGGLYGDAPVAAAPQPAPLKVANAKPLPVPSAPATGAYVVQLASFNSKAEAQAEYARLSSTHGAIITRYAPIITTGNIAGSTRYQLNLGPIASNDAASNVCAALISAGERDCKVGRQ